MNKLSKGALPGERLSWNIPLMYAITFFQGMVFYAPVASLYRQARGLTLGQIALIESISFLLSLALELPWGLIADRIGYRMTMIASCGVFFLSKVVFWQARSFGVFLLERILLSAAIAGLSGLTDSILYLSCAPDKSQEVLGRCSAFGTAGLLVSAGLFSLFIGDDYSLAGLATVISYGIAALLSLGIREVRFPESARRSQLKDFGRLFVSTWKRRRFLLLLVAAALYSETIQAVTVWLNQNQYLRCGIPVHAMGLIYLAVSGISLCSAFSQQVSEKTGPLTLGAGAAFLSGMMCLLLIWTRSGVQSVAAVMVMSACSALFGPLFTQVCNRQVRTADRATQLSIYAVISDVVSAGASLAYGRTADHSLSGAFCLGAVVCAFSGAAILICRKYILAAAGPEPDTGEH